MLKTSGQGGLRLIRPDGYTAFTGGAADVRGLSSYLDAHFVRA